MNVMSSVEQRRFRTAYTRPADIKKVEFIHRHLEACGAKRVLELGCGDGAIAMSLDRYEVCAVDISPEELAVAAARGVDGKLGDASSYVDGTRYDAVILSEVIEHVTRPELLFQNAARNLAPGGLLIVTTPNGYGFYEILHTHLNWKTYIYRSNLLRTILGRKPYVPGNTQAHCQWFTMGRVSRIAREAGFDLVQQENSDFVTGSPGDVELASRLPYWTVSGWFLAFRLAA